MSRFAPFLIFGIAVVAVAFIALRRGPTTPASVPPPQAAPSAARTIRVDVASWSFTPSRIEARRGEQVTIQLVGVSGTHGFSVPQLGINEPITAGQTKTITLPTSQAGTFDLLCSIPCGAGHLGMRGQIVIAS